MTISTLTLAAGLSDGDRRRDAALELLRDRRAVLVRRVQRVFVELLLDGGPLTSDPVRAVVPIPAGIDPRLIGAAVRGLAELDLIHRVGLSRSVRPEAHSRDMPIWAVSDRGAALAWLADHLELPDAGSVQRTLWT